jgi:hypothetical protein
VDDRHLRAVVRAALRASGFDVRMSELAAADRQTQVLGLRLRDLFLENLPGFAARTDIARLSDEDSFVWNRLPSMLAFGHQQAAVFRRLIHPDRRGLPARSLLPVAAFSAGLSLLDYLADALSLAEPIFEVVDEAAVAGLFGSGREGEARLGEAYEKTGDVRLRLLFALIATCGSGIRALHRRSGDDEGLRDLAGTFAVLHAAQRAVTFRDPDPAAAASGGDAVVTKSVLPFVAAHQIVELFDPPGAAKRSGRELARQIGRAVALTDDLVDLQADWQSRTPNTIIRGTTGPDVGPDGRPTDAWLYRVAEQTGERIVSILRSAALLHPPGPPATTAPLTAIEGAAKFATLVVARWVGWRAELTPPSVFSIRRPRPAQDTRGPAAAAVTMLLQQQRTGYQEAVHWMTVPRLGEDGVRLQTHPAIVFQRAIVLDSLLDSYAAGLDIPASVLAREALLLLAAKRADVRSGWSYLSGVPELPPDADDLAMVAQVLARCGGQPLAAACDQALNLVLDSTERGQALTTWVLDPGDAPRRNELFRRYIELTRADGVHPDVVANLLYAVGLQAAEVARRRAASAIAYLESAQDDDGSWRSRWYWGRYYGTYRAVLALITLTPDSCALDIASDFLVSGQNADGGWGADGGSDPLSTAFAIIALAALGQAALGQAALGQAALGQPGTGRLLRPAVAYLLATQQPAGSWPGCPFIAFPRVDGPGVHVYRSSTITTSFCLKALLASRGTRSAGRVTSGRAITAGMAYRAAHEGPAAADWS